MSVLIRGMEMPNKKNGAVLIIYPDGKCAFEDGKTYQAVSVPAHEDLMELNFCLQNYELLHDDDGNPVCAVRMREILRAPTIIPAEEGE